MFTVPGALLYICTGEYPASDMKEDRDSGPAFIYTGIRVKDMDESIAFYTKTLNMTVAEKRERTELTEGEVVT